MIAALKHKEKLYTKELDLWNCKNYVVHLKAYYPPAVRQPRDKYTLFDKPKKRVKWRLDRNYEVENNLKEKFNSLVSKWEYETDGYSTSFHKSINQNYLQIIALGKTALPLILKELKRRPNHWFIALKAITNVNPVPPEHMGNIKRMRLDWLAWAEENHLIQYMVFEPDYEFGMTIPVINRKWPNLKIGENFRFESKQTWDYNCVAWAVKIDDDWIQFEYTEAGELQLDLSIQKYVNYFTGFGFIECGNHNLEHNLEKICIYADENGVFTHVSLQLKDGTWASKMGEFEDIEHDDLNCLSGNFYGTPKVYMSKQRI